MLLQRQKPVRLWGKSTQPQQVRVLLNEAPVAEFAIQKPGSFAAELPAMEATENVTIRLEGSAGDTLCLSNVDVGEVWIAGGQSNMEFFLRYDAERKQTLRAAHDPHLRLYTVARYSFDGEEADGYKDERLWERWLSMKPETAETFSAVGLYFAQQLRRVHRVPIGIVSCNWGGVSASTWMDAALLKDDAELSVYLSDYHAATKDLELDAYIRADEAVRARKSRFQDTMNRYILEGSHKLLCKLAEPAIRRFPVQPIGPRHPNAPGRLYEAMLAKIRGFSCRGVLWYQGESDAMHPELYAKLFTSMIGCWRRDWQEEIPFLFVQLAPFDAAYGFDTSGFPKIRQQQELVAKTVPQTWMASIMDVGMAHDIHPKQKRPVGERLALLARGKIYGEDVLCDAPELSRAERTAEGVRLYFLHAGNGLHMRGKRLNALELCADGKPVTAWRCLVRGDTVTLTGKIPSGAKQLQLDHAVTPYCRVNLYNSADLPAKPFSITI